jgi:hypothetical protein
MLWTRLSKEGGANGAFNDRNISLSEQRLYSYLNSSLELGLSTFSVVKGNKFAGRKHKLILVKFNELPSCGNLNCYMMVTF